jgi:hypothetical protein
MEYLLGSLITIVSIVFANMLVSKKTRTYKEKTILYTQSMIHNVLAPILPTNQELKPPLKTQSKNHSNKNSVRVLFVSDKAYWIKDNGFYTANVVDGLVEEESTTRVDIMTMSSVQLKEMSFIVDKLTEGIDDENRYSGK